MPRLFVLNGVLSRTLRVGALIGLALLQGACGGGGTALSEGIAGAGGDSNLAFRIIRSRSDPSRQ